MFFVVEHEPAAEAALRLLARLRQHRVGPRGDDPHRDPLLRRILISERPGVVHAEDLRRLPGRLHAARAR